MADPKGLPYGRPPTQAPINQFVDERRRSVTEDAFGWVSPGHIYGIDTTVAPSDGALHVNPIGPLVRNTLVNRCRIRVSTFAATTITYTMIYVRDLVRKTLTLVPGTKFGHDATSNAVKTGSFTTTIKLLAGGDYWLGLVSIGGAPTVAGFGSTSNFMDRHVISGQTSVPTTINYADLTVAQGVIPGVVYYHSNVI